MEKYGERLKAARKIKGLTQTELATQLGITQKSYQRMESGNHDLKMSTIYQLCKALDISADWLIGLKVDIQKPISVYDLIGDKPVLVASPVIKEEKKRG